MSWRRNAATALREASSLRAGRLASFFRAALVSLTTPDCVRLVLVETNLQAAGRGTQPLVTGAVCARVATGSRVSDIAMMALTIIRRSADCSTFIEKHLKN